MYSLLVTHAAGEGDLASITVDRGRFLEYTEQAIRDQLQSLSREAVKALCSWPCLLLDEGTGDGEVRLVRVQRLGVGIRELKVVVVPVDGAPMLTNDALWRMRGAADIAQFEFSRNHWAIKEVDLFAAFVMSGYKIDERVRGSFEECPLPAPSRPVLLHARAIIGEWGHTEIDDLLLEIGIDEIEAGRQVGSRRDRANALLAYALRHPGAVTAEGHLLSAYLVARAIPEESQAISSTTLAATAAVEPVRPLAEGKGSAPTAQAERIERQDNRQPNRVFIVHGRNEAARVAVSDYLRSLGLMPIVLHEQASMGHHLLTKFMEEAELVTFAVIIMTDDDVGAARGEDPRPRARQNVILELGYFLSRLGQSNVCALISPGLETPSDFDGIVYISMRSEEEWQPQLRRELVAAGMPVV